MVSGCSLLYRIKQKLSFHLGKHPEKDKKQKVADCKIFSTFSAPWNLNELRTEMNSNTYVKALLLWLFRVNVNNTGSKQT